MPGATSENSGHVRLSALARRAVWLRSGVVVGVVGLSGGSERGGTDHVLPMKRFSPLTARANRFGACGGLVMPLGHPDRLAEFLGSHNFPVLGFDHRTRHCRKVVSVDCCVERKRSRESANHPASWTSAEHG